MHQFPIVGGIHLSCPDNFGTVDIRGVIYPLFEGIVFRRIADDHELLAGELFEPSLNLGSLDAEAAWAIPLPNLLATRPLSRSEMERVGE
jgi:hypothetical protein